MRTLARTADGAKNDALTVAGLVIPETEASLQGLELFAQMVPLPKAPTALPNGERNTWKPCPLGTDRLQVVVGLASP